MQRVGLSGSIRVKPRGVAQRLSVLRQHHAIAGGRLLEIGCGNGDYTAALAGSFELALATDLQWDELQAAKALGVETAQMSATSLAIAGDSIDVALAIEVLEHVSSVEDVSREIYRVLRPGGIFAFTSPNRWFPIETHSVTIFGRKHLGRYFPGLPYLPWIHDRVSEARNFKANELRALLTRIGFEEVATDYVPVPFDSWLWGRQHLEPKLAKARRGPLRLFTSVSVAGLYRKRSGAP